MQCVLFLKIQKLKNCVKLLFLKCWHNVCLGTLLNVLRFLRREEKLDCWFSLYIFLHFTTGPTTLCFNEWKFNCDFVVKTLGLPLTCFTGGANHSSEGCMCSIQCSTVDLKLFHFKDNHYGSIWFHVYTPARGPFWNPPEGPWGSLDHTLRTSVEAESFHWAEWNRAFISIIAK